MLEFIGSIKLPVWARIYLIYGDSSALDDNDLEEIDIWLDSLEFDSLTFDTIEGDESYFSPFPEFGHACEVLDCKLYGYRKS